MKRADTQTKPTLGQIPPHKWGRDRALGSARQAGLHPESKGHPLPAAKKRVLVVSKSQQAARGMVADNLPSRPIRVTIAFASPRLYHRFLASLSSVVSRPAQNLQGP